MAKIQSDENFEKVENIEFIWKYFELHANQRLVLFKYYIIFFSLFSYGIAHLIIAHFAQPYNSILMKSLSVAFVIVTIIFYFLDNRNRDLIHLAENAFRNYEKQFKNKSNNIKYKIFTQEKIKSQFVTAKHTFLFRCIFFLGFCAGIFIFIFNNIFIR